MPRSFDCRSVRGSLNWIVCACVCMFVIPSAFAQNISCSSSAAAGASPSKFSGVPCATTDSGQFSNTQTFIVSDEGGTFPATFTYGFSNSTQAASSLKQMQASASASATNSPAFYEYTDADGNGAQFNNPIIDRAQPQSVAGWSDNFTPGGPFPVGRLLQFRATLVMTGTPTSSECVTGQNDSSIFVILEASQGNTIIINTLNSEGGPGLGYQAGACRGLLFSVTSGVITAEAGFPFNLATQLSVAADTFAGYPPPPINVPFVQNGTAGVAKATVSFFLDPITAGATYTDSSGAVNSFLTPPSTVTVPDVAGESQSAATSAIVSTGLIVGNITSQSSNSTKVGDVISQSPSAGASVTDGSAVDLVISSGPPPVTVPNVVGQTRTLATTALTGVGLVLGTVTTSSSSTVSSGEVISESPTAGTSVSAGAAVNLVVSSGPAVPPAITVVMDGSPVVTNGPQGWSVTVTVQNTGNVTAQTVQELSATLNGIAQTGVVSPITELPAGATASLVLTFPASAGAAGARVRLAVSGSYSATSLSGNWGANVRALSLP